MIPRIYLYAAVAFVAAAGLSTLLYMSYSAGKQSVVSRLQSDRITVLQDGKKIDNDVLAADDAALRCLLIDCGDN